MYCKQSAAILVPTAWSVAQRVSLAKFSAADAQLALVEHTYEMTSTVTRGIKLHCRIMPHVLNCSTYTLNLSCLQILHVWP